MVRAAADRLAGARAASDFIAVNIALEAFLIHARNIRDFFRPKGRHNDVLARDFLSPPPRVRLSRLRNRRLKQRLDRAIAHLTFSRSRLGRRWRVQALLSEIDTAMAAFIARLETEKPVLARIMQVSNRDDG